MIDFKKLALVGVGLEIVIFFISYNLSADLSETFRYSARFSGRLSLLIFIVSIVHFASRMPFSLKGLDTTRTLSSVFALLHYIHLFLLFMNVKLNAVELIPYKLAGGIVAYLMILLYPIYFDRIKHQKAIHSVYFLYVGFVMAMTYIARMQGEFENASPELFHKVGLGLILGAMMYFIYRLIFSSRETTS